MPITKSSISPSFRQRAGNSGEIQPSFKLRASVAAILTATAIMASGQVYAADDAKALTELQAENLRLKKEIEALKQQSKGAGAAATTKTVTPSPALAVPSAPVAADKDGVVAFDKVIVTSRNREEVAQDVPLPVSVVSGDTLDRDNVISVEGLTQKVPSLGVFGSNPRQTSISIRGIGKNTANDTMEPSVGVIVDGVASAYVGQSWTDWVDVDRVEVVRGPQGTLLGKNTTLGALNISTKAPSFTPGYNFEGRIGQYNQLVGKASVTGPIQDGVLAYRASIFLDKKDGAFENTWQSGPETWNERFRVGGRLQFLLTPTENLSARIILDQIQSTENGNKSVLQDNGPATFSDGVARTTSFQSRLSRAYFNNADGSTYRPVYGNNQIEDSQARPQRTKQGGISAEINYKLPEHTLTSITAFRNQHFDIKNGGVTRFDIGNGGQQLKNDQFSQEIRLSSDVGGKVDYQVGLYYLNAEVYSDDPSSYGADAGAFNASNAQYNALSAAKYRGLLRDSQGGVYRSYVLNPTTESYAAFGQLNWHLTEKATLTLGLRDTYEVKNGRNSRELDRAGSALTNAAGTDNSKAANYGLNLTNAADLAAWNAAKQLYRDAIGNTYDWKDGEGIRKNSLSWLVNPSYQLTDDVLLYSGVSYGEKSGAVEFITASGATQGNPQNVKSEKVLNYEVGFKSLLLNRKLLLNANAYLMKVKDYQSNLTVPDATTTSGTRTYLGNIPGVTAKGLELDLGYAVNSRLRLTASGSYNIATYDDFSTVQPDISTTQIVNYAGRQLHGAPKIILNTGFDYSQPIGGGYKLRLYANNGYRSGSYLNSNLSEYTYQKAYSLLDGGLGVGTQDGKYEVSLVGQNLLDKEYATGRGTYSSSGAVTYQPGWGRSLGLVFRAKF